MDGKQNLNFLCLNQNCQELKTTQIWLEASDLLASGRSKAFQLREFSVTLKRHGSIAELLSIGVLPCP